MSVDISPDGRWIVFDLLAHIYRMPVEGGQAESITQNSGIALNYQPRYSPDGRQIAFVSDRTGQNNLWVMDADGSNPRPVFTNDDVRVAEPVWTPDGKHIIVRRQHASDHSEFEVDRLWIYSRDGGEGRELARFDRGGAGWPSVSQDGRYVYFHVCTQAGPRDDFGCDDVMQGSSQLQRLELQTGTVVDVTGGRGGAVAPELSPDGRFLAFARRIPTGTTSYKGHQFGPRSALWLRDLQTGSERVVMDPIETDMAERQHDVRPVFFLGRVLPGYSWARDGQSIVLSQGGKIRRLWLQTGKVETIPFSARVQRHISEMASSAREISDGRLDLRALRWPTGSRDGRNVVFQAVGRIWMTEGKDGIPRRLTSPSFMPFEFSPAWSPDGRWIAFTSWDDKEKGHLWKIPANGGSPEKLTQEPGEYIHPVWSDDGLQIVLARGSGATFRGGSWSDNIWYDLIRVPASGGPSAFIVRVNPPLRRGQIVRPSFGPDTRVFYPEQIRQRRQGVQETVTMLVSLKIDGQDKQVHLAFPYADEIVPSPDGKWVAFTEGGNVYATHFPSKVAAGAPIRVDKRSGKPAVHQLSFEGGLYPRWKDPSTVEFGSTRTYRTHHLGSSATSSLPIRLSVPRAIAKGSIALVGARLVTLDDRRIIEKGTIVAVDGRIQCVGECDTKDVDEIMDTSGKTIIPGFVDMHAHHHQAHHGVVPRRSFENAAYLAYGITTTFDPAASSEHVFVSAELIETGVVTGPRTFSTGDPFNAGDGFWQNEITSYDVAEQNVERLASWGVVTLKQYLQPRRQQRQWLADIARKKGLRVTGEANDHEYNLSMVFDGQTGFEHPLPYLITYSDVAKLLGRAQTTYSPTFVVGGAGPWNEDYFFQENEVWTDDKQRRFLPWRMLVPRALRRTLRPVTDYSFPLIAQALADIIAEGGYGAIGGHGQQHGIGSHWEIWMAASALGALGALEVASLHGARFLGAEKDIGSLTVGKLADLMVLNSNPLENIRNTVDSCYVMKAGILYDTTTLDEIWPERKPFGEYYWVDEDALRSDDRPVQYWDKREQP
jgi:Tol biopolymer transport system component